MEKSTENQVIDTEFLMEMKAFFESSKKEIELKDEKIRIQAEEIQLLKEQVEYLKRKLFGTKSEKSQSIGLEQLSLFNDAEAEADPDVKEDFEEISYTRKKHKGQLEEKLRNLPHEKVVYTLPEAAQYCSNCGTKMKEVGTRFVRNEVVFVPAKMYVKEIYVMTYECRSCRKGNQKFMKQTGVPEPVIPHSYTSAESVAHVMCEKFVKGVPLYRQEAEWLNMGIEVKRATLANWVIQASDMWLKPIVNRMHKELLKETYVHADETTVQVLREPGKAPTSKSYMWVYSSIKESEKPIRIFEYRPDRTKNNPAEFLKGFKGYAITDGYDGYNDIPYVTNVYCWAHARRKIRDALPKDIENEKATLPAQAMKYIKDIFVIEKKIENKTASEKVEIRRKETVPVLDEFFLWCSQKQNKVLQGSKLSKAINYCLNHEKGLREFVNDGYLPATNSLDERTIRMFAVGRKNWLFSTSVPGAESSAAAYSMIQTAKANGLDPYEYLLFIFTEMPGCDIIRHPERIDNFLPWNKLIQEKCKFNARSNYRFIEEEKDETTD